MLYSKFISLNNYYYPALIKFKMTDQINSLYNT